MVSSYHFRNTIVCPNCNNQISINRHFEKLIGWLWWKKTVYSQDTGVAVCNKCGKNFQYNIDMNNLLNSRPTTLEEEKRGGTTH